jgi:hypothetical protein
VENIPFIVLFSLLFENILKEQLKLGLSSSRLVETVLNAKEIIATLIGVILVNRSFRVLHLIVGLSPLSNLIKYNSLWLIAWKGNLQIVLRICVKEVIIVKRVLIKVNLII